VRYADPYLIVGAPGYGAGGAAYFYERFGSTWSPKAFHMGAPGDGVGYAVGIEGSWAIVGAPNADVTVNGQTDLNAGKAFVFKRDAGTGNWAQWGGEFYMQSSPTREPDDHYGTSVGTSGGRIIIGIPDLDGYDIQNQAEIPNAGAAQIYRYDSGLNAFVAEGWFVRPDGAQSDRFGATVVIKGTYAAIAAPGREVGSGVNVGAVYLYRLNGASWVADGMVTPLIAADNAGFGYSLDMSGTRLIVGSNSQHQAHVFKRIGDGQWVQDMRMSDPDGPDTFSEAVAINGNDIAVGDRYDDPGNLTDAGAAYIYAVHPYSADSCEGAIAVSSNDVAAGCTQNATLDGHAPCVALQASPDIWFKYYASSAGSLPINTIGSSIDTVLSVHTGCPGNAANAIACNDDFSIFENGSSLTFPVVAGQMYYIRAAGKGTARGSITLHTGAFQPAPACYANCDGSIVAPTLNVADFTCFLQQYAAGNSYANCDSSSVVPVLNVADFTCFLQRYAAGCQ
jgi:hypothetical protein